jgi:hypothetical protein
MMNLLVQIFIGSPARSEKAILNEHLRACS